MDISQDRKTIANHIIEVFGAKKENTKINSYWDEKNKSSIDLAACIDCPQEGTTSYSTIGLSEFSVGFKVGEKELRLEIVTAAYSRFTFVPNIISTCAFFCINDHYTCYPGATFKNVIKQYTHDTKLPNILMVSTFLWGDKLKNIESSEKVVTFLMAIPISDSELEYGVKNGTDNLEKLLEEKKVDVFDYARQSVI